MSREAIAHELSELWTVGHEHFPTVAADYRKAARLVASVEENEPYAFQSDLYGIPRAAWAEQRKDLEKLFSRTAEKLEETSAALIRIAEAYAENESVQSETLQAIAEQIDGLSAGGNG